MSAHNQLFTPALQEMKRMIDDGAVGRVRWIRSQDSFILPTSVLKGQWRSSLKFQGGYVEASYALTGENRTYNPASAAYNGIKPAHPFSLDGGGWGAWEIAGRLSTIDLNNQLASANGVAGGRQNIYTAALNWYVSGNIRFMFDYLHGDITKQVSPTNFGDTGSKFNAFAMRTQVAF